jgi:tetratricopeptide (TPR) repeat protein
MQGNIDEAIASFKQALTLNSKKEIYHNNLALAYFKKGQRELALNELKSAGDGDDAKAHYMIANLYYKEGAYKQAKEEYNEALKINPEMKQAKTKIEAVENMAKITETVNPKTETGKGLSKIEHSGKSPETNPVGGIEVSNGNGVKRMARGVAEYLKEHDLKVIRLTNADHFAYSNSRLYCQKEFLSTAREVNKRIPLPLKIQEVKQLDRPTIKVKLIIGKDLVNHKKNLGISARS